LLGRPLLDGELALCSSTRLCLILTPPLLCCSQICGGLRTVTAKPEYHYVLGRNVTRTYTAAISDRTRYHLFTLHMFVPTASARGLHVLCAVGCLSCPGRHSYLLEQRQWRHSGSACTADDAGARRRITGACAQENSTLAVLHVYVARDRSRGTRWMSSGPAERRILELVSCK
jgi:hypothetical protein